MAHHRGTLVLVFGILSLIGFAPLAPVAWWMGTRDVLMMGEGTMDRSGKTATEIGRFLGMFVTVILFVAFLGALILLWVAPA